MNATVAMVEDPPIDLEEVVPGAALRSLGSIPRVKTLREIPGRFFQFAVP